MMLEHREVTTSYRPPRVAVLIYSGSSWREWARAALSAITGIWGGEGFVLVPYAADGAVSPTLLRHLRQYDPDYLAVFAPGRAMWSALSPEALHDPLINGDDLLNGDDADGDVSVDDSVAPSAAAVAAGTLAAYCSLLRGYTFGTPIPQYLRLRAFGEPLPSQLTPLRAERLPAALVARSDWESDAALFAAFITGAPHTSRTNEAEPEPEQADLLRWLVSRDAADAPEPLTWFAFIALSLRSRDLAPWFETVNNSLGWNDDDYNPPLVTAAYGDSAADFALAVLLDRLHGQALWISETMLKQPSDQAALTAALTTRIGADPFERPAFVASASASAGELQQVVAGLRTSLRQAGLDDADEQLRATEHPVPAPQRRLLIDDHVSRRTTFPMLVGQDGTAVLAHEPDLPLPAAAESLLTDNARPGWFVDAAVHDRQVPDGRGVNAEHLHAPDATTWANLRDSKDGISFDAAFTGYLPAGTLLQHRLARPRLQFLGLMSWVQQAAARNTMTAGPSRPGQLSDLIAARVGGRDALRDLAGSPAGSMLHAFQSAEPSGDGRVRLRRDSRFESFLTFNALLQHGAIDDPTSLREHLDIMLGWRLLTRGFMLNCVDCGTLQFASIDRVGAQFTCDRCDAVNAVTAARWHHSSDEPAFYYDLHPAWRTVLSDSGDLPLLLGNRLARLARNYNDLAEIEFTEKGAVKPSFELDLIAHRDGELIIGESKESDLGGGQYRQQLIGKRLDAAEALQADRIVFGTALREWPQRDQDAVQTMATARRVDIPIDFVSDLRRGQR
ncbi:hypothetical protein [Curtobacterium sp. NPDC089689]|uniref:hypothetical protein n=1 Tax=Curtobacterium sp. NPDC089689 TaxID=3363968 RepID=UPI003822719B